MSQFCNVCRLPMTVDDDMCSKCAKLAPKEASLFDSYECEMDEDDCDDESDDMNTYGP